MWRMYMLALTNRSAKDVEDLGKVILEERRVVFPGAWRILLPGLGGRGSQELHYETCLQTDEAFLYSLGEY